MFLLMNPLGIKSSLSVAPGSAACLDFALEPVTPGEAQPSPAPSRWGFRGSEPPGPQGQRLEAGAGRAPCCGVLPHGLRQWPDLGHLRLAASNRFSWWVFASADTIMKWLKQWQGTGNRKRCLLARTLWHRKTELVYRLLTLRFHLHLPCLFF